MNFKIKNSRPLFTIIFKLKNDNFKTGDFSLLIERVLAGVVDDSQNYSQKTVCMENYELHNHLGRKALS